MTEQGLDVLDSFWSVFNQKSLEDIIYVTIKTSKDWLDIFRSNISAIKVNNTLAFDLGAATIYTELKINPVDFVESGVG